MPKDFDPTSPLRRANFFADCLLLILCQAEYLISLSDVFLIGYLWMHNTIISEL